jgi:hypothetical protein
MQSYLIQINAAAAQTMPDAAKATLQLHYVANGVDTLTLSKKFALLSGITSPYAYGDTVRLFFRDTEATPSDTCIFVGTVEVLPVNSGPQSTAGSYTIKGPTFDLQRCDYSQQWSYRDDAGDLQQDYDPDVCLCDNAGTRIKTGAQITAAVTYAATRGLNIALGTVAAGLFAPYDQKSNITCWDAIIAMLRYTPDHVVWWDYDNQVAGAYVPALNCTASTSMAATSLAHNTLNQIGVTPRNDLVLPGIQVIFDKTSTVDSTTYRSRSVQTAGSYNDPRRLSILYPLDGFHSTTQKQPIKVEPYPTLAVDAATKTWVHANVLWLRKLIYTDWDIKSVTRNGALTLANRLLEGSAPDWLKDKKDFEEEDITIKVEYTVKNSSDVAIKKETKDITLKVMSTEAVTKTYTRQSSFQSAEEEPANFATDLYTSWSVLHYAGSIGYKQQVPDPSLRPGSRINVTGAVAAWTAMNAIIQDTTINLPSGQITHNVGPCPRLEADTLMAIFRSVRARRFSTERMTRDDPDDVNDIWGATLNPSSSISDGAPSDKVEHMTIESSDGTKKISLQSTDLTAAATVKPRSVMIVESDDSGGLQAIDVIALCSDPADGTPTALPADGDDGQGIDHISLLSTSGLEKTYTVWGDSAETINLGTFMVTDGADGTNGTTFAAR